LTAFVRTKEPISFEAPDGNPVRLIFAVLVPEHATETHLQILSELAQMFSEAAMREALSNCPTTEQAYQLLIDWSPYAPSIRRTTI
jgi:PTS system nitrogen regulatory IIA component